jgi:hypothetical protein
VGALFEDDDLVAQQERLVDVVRDEDDGLVEVALQADGLGLQFLADDRVDGAERLVHQQDVGVGGETAGDADALLLPAGELARVAVGERRSSPRCRAARARASRLLLRRAVQAGTVATLSTTLKWEQSAFCST